MRSFCFWGSYKDADSFMQALHRLVEATLASARDCLSTGERTQFFLSEFKIRLSQRQHHWRAEALRFAREAEHAKKCATKDGGLEPTRAAGDSQKPAAVGDAAPEAEAVTPARTEAGPTVNRTNGKGTGQRAAIDAFISKLAQAGRKITRKNIWTAAGYTNATEFERFQRGNDRTTKSAAAAFKRVLNMKPEDFIRLLDRKPATK